VISSTKTKYADGVIDERDEKMIGNWNSPLYGGVNLTAKWKNSHYLL
jgi:hypothetical protein